MGPRRALPSSNLAETSPVPRKVQGHCTPPQGGFSVSRSLLTSSSAGRHNVTSREAMHTLSYVLSELRPPQVESGDGVHASVPGASARALQHPHPPEARAPRGALPRLPVSQRGAGGRGDAVPSLVPQRGAEPDAEDGGGDPRQDGWAGACLHGARHLHAPLPEPHLSPGLGPAR